mgnify:CR=1 FL=1
MSDAIVSTTDSPQAGKGRRGGRTIAIGLLAMLVAVLGLQFVQGPDSALAAESVSQCNGVDNTGGLGLVCEVTVVNNLDLATGVESSTVTTTECHGAANSEPSSCVGPTVVSYDSLTTDVNQCNGSENGGGSSIICSVHVVNNITGGDAPTGASVNQCNGSGEGGGTEPTLNCDPYPATTSGATVTQCNGSVNGGGASIRVNCSVAADATESAQLLVTINQCNDSANGGGSVATCTTELTTNALPAQPEGPGVPETPEQPEGPGVPESPVVPGPPTGDLPPVVSG